MRTTTILCSVLAAASAVLAAQARGFEPRTMDAVTEGVDPYLVHLGYVIPSNRAPQADAVQDLQNLATTMQGWFQDQMERNGFGPKTIQFSMEADGILPAVHLIDALATDDYIRGGTWGRTMDAVNDAGFSVWKPGDAWLLIPESHLQQPNGKIIGGFAGGAHVSPGGGAGVAMVGSDMIPRVSFDALSDETPYDGQTIPEIGPYPLVQDVSFPWFERDTISSVSSSAQGAIVHELGHAFGLLHDFRNDQNFHGNLMGNGLRGWRGSLLPELFPDDETRLAYGAAVALNSSRFFNSDVTFDDQTPPTLNVLTAAEVDPVDGRLQISFSAADESGISGALLQRSGSLIGEMELDGTSVQATFETSYFDPGEAEQYTVIVYDQQGNRNRQMRSITVHDGFNQAPQPYVKVSDSLVQVGAEVLLDASRSSDDGQNHLMTVEWDLDGDGVFDTPPSTDKTLLTTFDEPGTQLVVARLTDEEGAFMLSAPLSMQIEGDLIHGPPFDPPGPPFAHPGKGKKGPPFDPPGPPFDPPGHRVRAAHSSVSVPKPSTILPGLMCLVALCPRLRRRRYSD